MSKSFGGKPVVTDLTLRVMRGDRIGLIGPNGSGKTTLLKMLMGELAPDSGEVRRGTNVQLAYYDQQREQLDPERTVWETVADGHDTVIVNGQPQHVHGYLRNFLFPPERALSPSRRCQAASGTGCSWRGCWPARSMSSCWTNRPTISTSKRSSSSRSG